jgi:hypothetical protein
MSEFPQAFRTRQRGMYVTFVVPDVDAVYCKAKALGVAIVQEPKNEVCGQRRFLTLDPNG